MPIDWPGIQTAILDVERRRLGLPSREELAMKRAEAQRAAEAHTSDLETAALNRQQTQMNIDTQPALRQAQADAAQARGEAALLRAQPRSEPTTLTERLAAETDPVKRQALIDAHKALQPERGEPIDRAAYQQVNDAGGNILGYFHRGQFIPKEQIPGFPAEARRPLSAGEKSEMALLENPARLAGLMRETLGRVRVEEKERPIAAGTGVVMGTLGNLYRNVDTSGAGGDFDALRKQVRQIVYGLSGKQLNQSELAWLDSITPNLSDPGVDEQINRLDAFITSLVESKRRGMQDPFTTARLGFGVQRGGNAPKMIDSNTMVKNGKTYRRGTGPDGRPGWVRVRE